MRLDDFARQILFGTTLDEKLFSPEHLSDEVPGSMAFETPQFPGRPAKLSRLGTAPFPSVHQLHKDTTRGQVLHFFANHELLATELMALTLLRFPTAPQAFRMGLAQTIFEEQSHMRLYLERMHELGVEFGDLPLNDYFWNCLKPMRSPLDFVTQMSLTFEQANLDFSLYYRDQIAKTGDSITAAILERVYQEEIGHVKHGLSWFNRWREGAEKENDWEAYVRLLPPPLTPRRAKGIGFCADARRLAGFSEVFIRELEMSAGSKGRPPVVWLYNPSCDSEIARGSTGFSANATVQRLTADLEHFPMFLSREPDVVLVSKKPDANFLQEMRSYGFFVPEFAVNTNEIREPKLGGFQPWGWSPESFSLFQKLKSKLIESKNEQNVWTRQLLSNDSFKSAALSDLFSKSWSAEFFRQWLDRNETAQIFFGSLEDTGNSFTEYNQAAQRIKELLAQGKRVVAKAPWGTAGNQVKRFSSLKDLDGNLSGWLRNTIAQQNAVVIEPWLDKQCDLSMQFEVRADETHLLEVRQFLTDSLWQYRGTRLGRKLSHLPADIARFISAALPAWQKLIGELGETLRAQGFQGTAGVDAMVWRDTTGELRLKPMVELNPRWTMGRIALALETHLHPGSPAALLFYPQNEIISHIDEIRRSYPVKISEAGTISDGVVFLNDPAAAQELIAALVVGSALSIHADADKSPATLKLLSPLV